MSSFRSRRTIIFILAQVPPSLSARRSIALEKHRQVLATPCKRYVGLGFSRFSGTSRMKAPEPAPFFSSFLSPGDEVLSS